jgi:hypothetical protein
MSLICFILVRHTINLQNYLFANTKTSHQSMPTLNLKGSNNAIKLTHKQLTKLRINNDLKFLYIKKQQINNQPYKTPLTNSQYCQTSWPLIENDINQRLNEESEKHY